jgi:hypothetical protein
VLLTARAISWTRIFEDIESTLPPNVRLISVRPQLTTNHELLPTWWGRPINDP